MTVLRLVEDIPWMPHPTADGIEIKPMVTRKDHGAEVSCLLVKIPAGRAVPEHIHEDRDDILFPLTGCGIMWVERVGDFMLQPGVVVRVPNGVRHKIEKVTQELLIYDVFSPYLL